MNELATQLDRAYGDVGVEIESYYSHAKVSGERIDRFLTLMREEAHMAGDRIHVKWLDHDTAAVKYVDG